jgi:hypothetical protein
MSLNGFNDDIQF